MQVVPGQFQGENFFVLATGGLLGGMNGFASRCVLRLRDRPDRAMVPASVSKRAGRRPVYPPMSEETTQQASDLRLLDAVARGDQTAFAALYDRLSGPLYSLCLRMTGEIQEAEDILQEACVTIWRRAASYDPEKSSVFSWAVHLTRCKTIDHLRSRGRRLRVVVAGGHGDEHQGDGGSIPADALSQADNAATASDTMDRHEQAARVRRVLTTLPAEQSQVIQLAFFNDLSHHEISSRLDQPLGTVKARIRRGLLKLRDGLKGGHL